MGRAKWKSPYFKNQKSNDYKKLVLKSSQIVPNFLGRTFFTYNGKLITKIIVLEEMIGHKFGEFCFTRKEFFFSKANGTKG
jgi:small subunit ribosomal protein S19